MCYVEYGSDMDIRDIIEVSICLILYLFLEWYVGVLFDV